MHYRQGTDGVLLFKTVRSRVAAFDVKTAVISSEQSAFVSFA